MIVEIASSIPVPAVVRGCEMKAGEYGLIVEDHCERNAVGHYVYRHGNDSHILNLSRFPDHWDDGKDIKVELLPPGSCITITRTE